MSPPPERGPPGNEGSVGMAELSIPGPQRLAEPHTGPADAPSQRKGFPKGFPSLFPTLRVNNASSTKCTFWGTPDTRTGRKHPTPDMEPLLGKGCFQNLLSTTPASPQSFYFRPETWNGRTEKHAQSRRPPPRCAQERGGRGRWAPEARRRARRRLRVWGDWVLGGRALGAGGGGPLRSPSASSRSPARAASCPRAPPRRPPAPAGCGSSCARPPASCSPPSRGAAGGLRWERPAAARWPPLPHSRTPGRPAQPRPPHDGGAPCGPGPARKSRSPGQRRRTAGGCASAGGGHGGRGGARAADPGNLQTAGGAAHARCSGERARSTWRTGWALQGRGHRSGDFT